jgi:hypothetical protein
MPKLNDTQTILLSTAAQRDDGSLYPLPETLNPGARTIKAIASLVTAQLLEERETRDTNSIARTDGDLSFGLYITTAGLAAIGIEPAEVEADAPEVSLAPADEPPARTTKSALVLDLLEREGGATLAELMTATGWLPHTTRAALTGLRKKGHAITRGKRGEATCYTLAVA